MFVSHLAKISVDRAEPDQGFDAATAAKHLARRFAQLAEQIVTKDILKAPPLEKKRKRGEEKIREAIETEERYRSVKGFLEIWNKWRYFYFELSPIDVKNKSQLTQIENAIAFCSKNEYDLNMMIACVHRSYLKRNFKPGFTAITGYGEEIYDKFYDQVNADMDEVEYMEKSKRRNRE